MEIREIRNTELASLLELYMQLHESDSPLPAAAIVEATWNEIQRNTNIRYFGAFIDGALVSTCTIAVIPNLTRSCRPYGLIENVVTASNYRKQGLGKLVLHAALDLAWQWDCYKVMLMTSRLDEPTLRFYESAGFSRKDKHAFVARCPTWQDHKNK
jgi:GNAT superfamily N-acetyltransferase